MELFWVTILFAIMFYIVPKGRDERCEYGSDVVLLNLKKKEKRKSKVSLKAKIVRKLKLISSFLFCSDIKGVK